MATTDMSFLGLNRPQYVSIPELHLAALAWSLDPAGSTREIAVGATKFDGLAYRQREIPSARASLKIASTFPHPHDEHRDAIAAALMRDLSLTQAQAIDATEVLLCELEVVASLGSKRSAAAPLTLEAALLQDVIGLSGVKNPPAYALIIEQFFALGGGSGSAAAAWLTAVERSSGGAVPEWLNHVLGSLAPKVVSDVASSIRSGAKPLSDGLRKPVWLAEREITPFRWFAKAWTSLCGDSWIDHMPRRRWTDWATCVLRTAIASGYLFEMHLTQRLTLGLIQSTEPRDVVASALEDAERLLAWDSSRTISARDVEPVMGSLSATGTACRNLLAELQKAHPDMPSPSMFDHAADGLEQWLHGARTVLAPFSDEIRRKVAAAIDGATYTAGSGKNVREMIRFSFLGRGAAQSVDLYGLLSKAGRYSLVDPGQEWLVAVASLTAAGPRQPARLASLNKALRSLGIAANTHTLVSKLEAYGLARSSHDADEAIEIQPAF
jgi:hypothetical protein